MQRNQKHHFICIVKAPKGIKGGEKFKAAEDFSQWLLREKLISTVPWDEVEPYVRLSVTFLALGEAEEKDVMQEIYDRLSDVEFEFE